MNALQLLKEDHDYVKKAFSAFEKMDEEDRPAQDPAGGALARAFDALSNRFDRNFRGFRRAARRRPGYLAARVEAEKEKFLAKLRQIEDHASALAGELPRGETQNRARLIWALASQLVLRHRFEPQTDRPGAANDGKGVQKP
jgi:hypothetical protein